MNTKQIKILVSNGKTQLYHSNFQIIEKLSIVEYQQALYTVVNGKIPINGGWISIFKLIENGENIQYVS